MKTQVLLFFIPELHFKVHIHIFHLFISRYNFLSLAICFLFFFSLFYVDLPDIVIIVIIYTALNSHLIPLTDDNNRHSVLTKLVLKNFSGFTDNSKTITL